MVWKGSAEGQAGRWSAGSGRSYKANGNTQTTMVDQAVNGLITGTALTSGLRKVLLVT